MQSDPNQNCIALDCMQSDQNQNCIALDCMQSDPIQNCFALDCTTNEAFLFCINRGGRGCDLNQDGFKREGRPYDINPKSGYSFLSVERQPSPHGWSMTTDGEGFFTCVQ